VPPVGTNPTFANFLCLYNSNGSPTQQCTPVDVIARPGVMQDGRGFYFHQDLAGNVAEWAMDYKHPYPAACLDCVNRTPASQTISRGGGFASPAFALPNAFRGAIDNDVRYDGHGARCARRP
jgi:formylglycine-generating enzyme required for sulfatase activity